MGDYGPASPAVDRLIQRIALLDVGEAADLYRAYVARLLLSKADAERTALQRARGTAARVGRVAAYDRARHSSARAWRSAVPPGHGPWLAIGRAISNAAGALVLEDALDAKAFQFLVGPWQQAIGTLTPVGPGVAARPALAGGARR